MLTYLFIGVLSILASFMLIFGVINATSKKNKILFLIVGVIAIIILVVFVLYLLKNPSINF